MHLVGPVREGDFGEAEAEARVEPRDLQRLVRRVLGHLLSSECAAVQRRARI